MANTNTGTTKNKDFDENPHEKVINAIQYFINRHGAAYPSIAKLSKQSGLDTPVLLRVLKELETAGRIKKSVRYDPKAGRKSSNLYEIIKPAKLVDRKRKKAYFVNSFKKEKDFKKDVKKDLKSSSDELNISHYKHKEFFEIAKERGIPKELAVTIFRRVKKALLGTSLVALSLTFGKLQEYAATISHPPAWFATVLSNTSDLLRI